MHFTLHRSNLLVILTALLTWALLTAGKSGAQQIQTSIGGFPISLGGPLTTSAAFTTTGAGALTINSGSGATALTLGTGTNIFSSGITINPLANTSALAISGASHTGSDATSDFSLSTTLNTSGAPDVFAVHATVTGAGAATKLLNIYGGASGTTSEFSVSTSGLITIPNSFTVGSAAFPAGNGIGMASGQLAITSAGNGGWGFISADNVLFESYNHVNTNVIIAGQNAQIGFTNASSYTTPSVNVGTVDAIISRSAPATLHLGTVDAASPVAQTLGVQGVVAGMSNTAGALWTFQDSVGTGTGASGGYKFQVAPAGSTGSTQNSRVDALIISGAGQAALPQIASDATHTDSTVCQDTTTHTLLAGSGAAGICLGTSSARYKHDIKPIETDALVAVMGLKPVSYRYNVGHGDPNKDLYGFIAEDVDRVLPELVGLDKSGKPNSVDWAGLVPFLVKAIQEQQREIAVLQARK